MDIYVSVKSAGKRKAFLDKKPYTVSNDILTLKDLITDIVKIEVSSYNSKNQGESLVNFLTESEIAEQKTIGKVGFGRIYSDKKADEEEAIENALRCFEDGLFKAFKNDDELCSLDEEINLKENDVLTFIRLAFLAGSLW